MNRGIANNKTNIEILGQKMDKLTETLVFQENLALELSKILTSTPLP